MPINMAHCRFENTLAALRECDDTMHGTDDMSTDEVYARERLLTLCHRIANEFASEIEDIHAGNPWLKPRASHDPE